MNFGTSNCITTRKMLQKFNNNYKMLFMLNINNYFSESVLFKCVSCLLVSLLSTSSSSSSWYRKNLCFYFITGVFVVSSIGVGECKTSVDDAETTTAVWDHPPTTRNTTHDNHGYVKCCTKKFKCDETSATQIYCPEPFLPFLLKPHENSYDEFVIVHKQIPDDQSPERYKNQTQLYVADFNNTFTEFCLGWALKRSTLEDLYEREKSAVICSFHHDDDDDSDDNDGRRKSQLVLFKVGVYLASVSALFSLITLFVYFQLVWLRDLQGKIIICLLISICVSYLTIAYLYVNLYYASDLHCIVFGFFTYYWWMAMFTWLHITCFNMWRTIVLHRYHRNRMVRDKRLLFKWYLMIGWCTPAVFLAVSLTAEFLIEGDADSIKPNFGKTRCWFHKPRDQWIFFYGPILFMLFGNIIYFGSVIYYLNKDARLLKSKSQNIRSAMENTNNGGSGIQPKHHNDGKLLKWITRRRKKMNASREKYKLYLRMFFAMGITYIFEIISSVYYEIIDHEGHPVLRYLFMVMDIVNLLLGLVLFILLVATRPRVWRGLLTKYNITAFQSSRQNDNNCTINETDENDDDDDEDYDEEISFTDNEEQTFTTIDHNKDKNNRVLEEIQMK